MGKRKIHRVTTTWNGIDLEISFERNWLSSETPTTAHIEVQTVKPEREPLPITETGFRSHFCHPQIIDEAGGPVAFVLAWLEAEGRTQKWRANDFARRQLSLF